MAKGTSKNEKRIRLKRKIRTKIFGTQNMPRLSVYRSNNNIYAQLIDDAKQITLASASDIKEKKGTKIERAELVGRAIADVAKAKGIKKVMFDRNGFKYTGRVKLVADSARSAGLEF
jgi:large subunit ribosomal protein L18